MAHTLQERYSSLVLAKLRKQSIFVNLFNRRYEGTPKAGAVKIPVRATEVKVGDYNKANGVNLEQGTTTYKTLAIDKDKAVNELIDGYEASAVPDGMVADRLDSAGYSMAMQIDSDLAALLTTKGTASKNTTPLAKDTIYDAIVDEVQEMKKLGVATSEMWLAVTNETFGKLLKAPEFIKASDLGDAVVQNGIVGRIAGVDVYETNAIDVESTHVEFILGNRVFCHYVDEWAVPVHVADLKDGKHIGASAVQGRRVYGSDISETKSVIVKKNQA